MVQFWNTTSFVLPEKTGSDFLSPLRNDGGFAQQTIYTNSVSDGDGPSYPPPN